MKEQLKNLSDTLKMDMKCMLISKLIIYKLKIEKIDNLIILIVAIFNASLIVLFLYILWDMPFSVYFFYANKRIYKSHYFTKFNIFTALFYVLQPWSPCKEIMI